ncbi:MAG: TlpA disulfide reductase family protein [Pseudomonadota bacterium]|nr:TlpA disulfide reductase family protein [Pseudomonadota bacterium]
MLLLLLLACARPQSALPSSPLPALNVDPVASPGTLASLDEAGLAALLANPGQARMVVNFWATWCGPCVREMDVFRAVAGEHPDVRFALVNVESRGSSASVLRFLSAEGGGLPAFNLDTDDASGLLSRAVPDWPDIIPVTLVLDPGGAIRARFDGALDAPALRAALAP